MPVSPSVANANGYNPGVFVPGLGFRVTKTEDLSGAQDDLFVVTGKVLMSVMTGEVTNAIDAAVTDYEMLIKGIPGSNIIGSSSLSGAEVGAIYNVSGRNSDSILGTSTAYKMMDFSGGYHTALSYRVIGLSGGTLTIESTHTAGAAGDAIVWSLYYLPLEAGASVAAAA